MNEDRTVAGAFAKIEAHEDLCAERYGNIHATLEDLKSAGKDQRKVQWGVLIALLGFMAMQVFNNQQAHFERLDKAQTSVVVQNRPTP
jgi:hypothetical protein